MYVELHCHSAFSLREGASMPEELVLRARELGYSALALTDHDGLYGAMEFAQTAKEWNVRPISGAELTLADGHHLTLLAADRKGYGNLCRLITAARAEDREQPRLDPALLPTHAEGLIALSGCRQGEAAARAARDDLTGAEAALRRYREWFTPGSFYVELQQNLVYGDTHRNAVLTGLARGLGLPVVATNNVHYHARERHRLQDVLVAIRNCTTLDGCHRERRANSEFYLKSSVEMEALFRDLPEAIQNTALIAERCAFNLATDLDYTFPDYQTPPGETADSYLASLCRDELARRYGPLEPDLRRRAEERLTEELRLIARHRLAGFFLHYRDLLVLARRVADEVYSRDPSHPYNRQGEAERRGPGRGRGSSVGSIVCYLIGLSHIDPVKTNLFLGRFLNEELASVPDIDLDFPREVRAELIERIFHEYGHEHAALVCTFPTYQFRSAVRDVGKALALPESDLDRLSKQSGWASATQVAEQMALLPAFRDRVDAPVWRDLIAISSQLAGFPRHVSQHVGGIIISSRPLVELVPLEPAAMEGRQLCGWDKDSVDDARFIKIDFLALGMLSLVDECLALISEQHGRAPDLGRIPHDDERVFDMICAGDTIGVFQVESRAQTQILPRTLPRDIAALTIEVAIVRPGPIVGGAISPFVLRRQGRQAITYDHPLLEGVLKETYGVVLYQEQVLQVAMVIAGFSAGQAESLRRAMSRKRSREAMDDLWEPFRTGAQANGVDEATAAKVFEKLAGFAAFGFPKSHAAAFALLVYESAWLKLHYPVEFYTSLLNNQPMGFYSPAVIVGDAKRHGIEMLPVDINASQSRCTVEDSSVRMGCRYVEGLGEVQLERLDMAREHGPYRSLSDFCRRTGLAREAIENLIAVGAFDSMGMRRRELLWQLGLIYRPDVHGAATRRSGDGAEQALRPVQEALALPVEQDMVELQPMTSYDEAIADYAISGLSTRYHWMQFFRRHLAEDVISSRRLQAMPDGTPLRVAGLVVCRQRPGTAKGFLFVTLEDEWGLSNVIVKPDVYERLRMLWRTEPLLIVRGVLQNRDGVPNVIAINAEALPVEKTITVPHSKDFS
jgi:error-prone DNA polymerase